MHYAIDSPDAVEAINFAMEQHGLSVKDLVPMIGVPNRIYEVLNRKRPLSQKMIWRLRKDLARVKTLQTQASMKSDAKSDAKSDVKGKK